MRRLTWFLILALMLVLIPVPSVSAHAEVLGSSPAAGSTVGGSVDRIDIVFADQVSSATIELSGPDGPVPGEVVQTEGLVIALKLERTLETEGLYQVKFAFSSIDEDLVELEYSFTYQKSAPESLPVAADATSSGSSSNTVAYVFLGAATAALGGLLTWRYLRQSRARPA